jgi:hypothetical protein
MDKKGMVGNIVAVIVSIIAIVAVAIPIATSVVASANLTGINATIVQYIPTFLALAGLALVAGMVGFGA